MAARRRSGRTRRGGPAPRTPALAPPRRAWVPWLAALVPLLVYWPTLGHGFLLDDVVLFRSSASLEDPGSIARGFLTDVGALRKGAETVISSYYRPLFLALTTLYHQLVGGEPRPWHLAAVLMAALVGALASGLLLRWGLPPASALLASLVFSLHPSHVSSVAWASGLQELLAGFFSLACMFVLAGRPEADARRRVALAAALYAAALLCKEVAVAGWLFVLAWLALSSRQDSGPDEDSRPFGPRVPRARLRLAALVLGAVTLAYLAVRVAVLGALARPLEGAPGFVASLPSIPVAAAAYLRLLLLPAGFSIFRPERPVAAPLDPAVLAAVAALAGAAALAAWAVRRRPRLLPPLAWLVAWLLPVLNVWALDPQWMVTDRYLFLPSLALPWAIAVALPRRAALATLALLAVAFAGLTLRYAAIFRDERTFVTTMARVEPTSPLLFAERARLERAAGRRQAARASLERAVALDPLAPGAQLALGEMKLEAGELAAAEAHFRQVLVRRPYASAPFKRLALAWAARGEATRAGALAAETARRWPEDFEAQLLDALFRAQRGERREAEVAFARARALRPDDPAVAGGLDAAAARLLPRLLPPDSRSASSRPASPAPALPR